MTAMTLAIVASDVLLSHTSSPLWLRFALSVSVGSATYLLILRRFRRDELRVLLRVVPGRLQQPIARVMGLKL
jgi:hypothetical protein